jgi:hypothetical protein
MVSKASRKIKIYPNFKQTPKLTRDFMVAKIMKIRAIKNLTLGRF